MTQVIDCAPIVFSNGTSVCLDMNMTQNTFAKARLSDHIADEGLLAVRENNSWSFSSWCFTGTRLKQEGRRESVLFEGQAFTGKTLGEDFSYAAVTVEALENANRGGIKVPNVGAGGIFISDGEGPNKKILFLPEYIFTLASSSLGNERESSLNGFYVRKDLSGTAAVNFLQAAIAYRSLTKTVPFAETNSDRRYEDIRDANFLPVSLIFPDSPQKLSFFIDNSLKRNAKTEVHKKSFSAKKRSLQEAVTFQIQEGGTKNDAILEGISFPLEDFMQFLPKATDIQQKISSAENSQKRKSFMSALRTKRWFRKNSTLLSIVAAAVLVLAVFSFSYIRGNQNNPTTVGMTSRETTEFFYSAYNSLDIIAVKESTQGSQMRKLNDMLSGFYVSAKSKETYSGSGKTYSPAQWFWRNRGASTDIYGLTQLTINGEPASLYAKAPQKKDRPEPITSEDGISLLKKGDTAKNLVTYYFVYSEDRVLHVIRHNDKVSLTFNGKKWLVSGISENAEEKLFSLNDFADSFEKAKEESDGDIYKAVLLLSETYDWVNRSDELTQAREDLIQSDLALSGSTDLQ